jgi:intracellular septation protein A
MSIVPTLVFDAILPVVIFDVLSAYHAPTLWALTAGGISPLFNNLRTWIRSRRLEPIGALVLFFLVVGAATSLISGNVFFALIKDSFITGTVGLVFLATLFAKRPLVFYVIRQFVAGDDPERIAWWNGLWVHPEVRQGTRVVTAAWGVVYLIEAATRVVMALTLTPAQVVSISPIMGIGATVLLILFTRRYMEQMRQRREARLAAGG